MPSYVIYSYYSKITFNKNFPVHNFTQSSQNRWNQRWITKLKMVQNNGMVRYIIVKKVFYWLKMLSFWTTKNRNHFHTMTATSFCSKHVSIYHATFCKNNFRDKYQNKVHIKSSQKNDFVTKEVFFLARLIHNWQLFAAPLLCARRIICTCVRTH